MKVNSVGYIFHFQRCPPEGFSIDLDYVATTAWFILVEVRVVNSGVSAKRSHIQVYHIPYHMILNQPNYVRDSCICP